ncbi:MAG: hypothetical protein ACOH2F_09095 [Cellulomonas sp.]
MQSKAAFIIGAGLGYILGTRAGREQWDKATGWTRDAWSDPRVQSQVNDLSAKATEFAKTEGSALKDRMAEFAKTEGSALKEKLAGTVEYVVESREDGSAAR